MSIGACPEAGHDDIVAPRVPKLLLDWSLHGSNRYIGAGQSLHGTGYE